MLKYLKSPACTTGLAMFAMFFGAGNVVFPLAVGQYAKDNTLFAIAGLLITAVGVPFLGLLGTILFGGDSHRFFSRLGKIPGFLLIAAIMGLIGPFGAMPRTIALAFSTSKMFWPDLSLPLFSLSACILVFFCTIRKNKIVTVLGAYLTPLLLAALLVIVVKGIATGEAPEPSTGSSWSLFAHGLSEGYQTMDLLATFFFSSVVIANLRRQTGEHGNLISKKLIRLTLISSTIGATLLALVYVGFSIVASMHSTALGHISADGLLGKLAIEILGAYAGVVACVAIALACLTTAIALAAVFSEFLQEELLRKKVPYSFCLTLTLISTFFVSTLEFSGIVKFLAPILQICYPALIVLCIMNILYKFKGIEWVKTPVAIAFLLSLWGTLG